jgi:hypothetical protein
MLEILEAIVIAAQLNQTIKDKRIEKVIAAAWSHKFAWFFGDPSQYHLLLHGRKIENTAPYGGRNTERDLFGNWGRLSNETEQKHRLSLCRSCGGAIKKETYMGGSIYYCEQCQEK